MVKTGARCCWPVRGEAKPGSTEGQHSDSQSAVARSTVPCCPSAGRDENNLAAALESMLARRAPGVVTRARRGAVTRAVVRLASAAGELPLLQRGRMRLSVAICALRSMLVAESVSQHRDRPPRAERRLETGDRGECAHGSALSLLLLLLLPARASVQQPLTCPRCAFSPCRPPFSSGNVQLTCAQASSRVAQQGSTQLAGARVRPAGQATARQQQPVRRPISRTHYARK